jgi:hypothetical protein
MFRKARWELTPLCILLVIAARLAIVVFAASHRLYPGDDGVLYDDTATSYAFSFWSHRDWSLISWGWGTNNYALYAGALYSVFGPHRLALLIFNSALAGVGSFLFLGVLLDRYPKAHPALRLLTVLDPSMLWWTSIYHKDPLMYFFLALTVRGIHRAMSGLKPTAAFWGIGLMLFIRPQIAAIVLLAMLIGYGWYKTVALMLASFATAFFWLGGWGYYTTLLEGISYGGSALTIQENPLLQIPYGLVAAAFRPFPWEPGPASLRVAAIYGILTTLAILLIAWRLGRTHYALSSPFRRFLAAYCVGLTIFVGLLAANLGTIARERTQLTPFLWLLLASLSAYPILRTALIQRRIHQLPLGRRIASAGR